MVFGVVGVDMVPLTRWIDETAAVDRWWQAPQSYQIQPDQCVNVDGRGYSWRRCHHKDAKYVDLVG